MRHFRKLKFVLFKLFLSLSLSSKFKMEKSDTSIDRSLSTDVSLLSSMGEMKDLKPIKLIKKSKTPHFLAYSKSAQRYCIMKIFPLDKNQ